MNPKSVLSSINPHPRDPFIEFEESNHSYTVELNGVRVLAPTSATKFAENYFTAFNAARVVNANYWKWKQDTNSTYYNGIHASLDAGATDSAQLEWVASDAGAQTTTVKTLQLRLSPAKRLLKPLAAHERAYLLGLAAVEAYAQVGHAALFGAGVLPFAPLMLVSVYGALGVSYVWAAEAAHHSLASVYRIIEVTCVSATEEAGHSSGVRALGPGKRARHRAHMPPCMVVGCRVRKRFLDGKLYAGTVVDVSPADPFPVTVEYEDGDVESYSVEDVRDQLELYLPPGMVVGRRVRKRCEELGIGFAAARHHARARTKLRNHGRRARAWGW